MSIIQLLPIPLLCVGTHRLLNSKGSGKAFPGIPGWLNEEAEDREEGEMERGRKSPAGGCH